MTPLEKQLHKERRLLYRRRVSIPDFVRQVIFSGMSLAEVTKRVQYAVIAEVLHRTGGNQTQAAQLLHVHRNTLVRQIAAGKKRGMLESWEAPKMPARSAEKPLALAAQGSREVNAEGGPMSHKAFRPEHLFPQ